MDPKQTTRIMLLDDEPIVCKRLQPVLEKNGYYVETFYQSQDALNRFREEPFHIVVTDLKMKELDGMGFLTEVKKISPETEVKKLSPETEVIVITGFATMETAKESFRKGVFDFLAKPFKLGEIQEVIQNAEKKFRKNVNL